MADKVTVNYDGLKTLADNIIKQKGEYDNLMKKLRLQLRHWTVSGRILPQESLPKRWKEWIKPLLHLAKRLRILEFIWEMFRTVMKLFLKKLKLLRTKASNIFFIQ